MSTNRTRYQVGIPVYICVMLDENLSVVSHHVDTDTCILYPDDIKAFAVDYETPSSLTHDVHHPDVKDQFGNALVYARGLRVLNYNQLKDLTGCEICEMPGREEPF